MNDRLRGGMRRGPWAKRVSAGLVLLLAAVVGLGCSGAASGALGNPVSAPEPTPWTEGTLRAVVGATLDAAARPPETVTPAPRPARAVNAPGASARPTPVPALATFVAAQAAPTPPPSARVEAVDFNAYRIEAGWTFVQGFARNTGAEPAGDIKLFVILLGDGDVVVGTAHAHVAPLLLDPGEQAPWLAQVQGVPDVQRVRVQVSSQPLTDGLRAAATREFRLDDVAVRPPADPYGPPTIGGTVVNVGAMLATAVEVTAAIFDADGALYQVVRATAPAPEILPGQGVPFEIKPLGRGLKEIPRYELFVAGRPKP